MTLPISYFRFYFPEYVLKTRLPPNCATGFFDRLKRRCKSVSFFITKGSFSTVENDPLETPRERKGCALDLPSPVFYEAATARAVQNIACNAWRGFRFGLLLAAAAALRRGFGHFLAGG